MPRPPSSNITDLTVHNLSSRPLTADERSLLTKGLSFAPTPHNNTTEQYLQLLRYYNDFARSVRPLYSHSIIKPTSCSKPITLPQHKQIDTDRSFIYRRMKFLPKQKYITATQQFSGFHTLENYIDQTKTELEEKLPLIYPRTTPNLNKQARLAIKKFKQQQTSVTIKPADKNLGVVILDTDDYIQQCTTLLSDKSTYRLVQGYPATDIQQRLQRTIIAYSTELKALHKNLPNFLLPSTNSTQPPNFYGIPKIHKQFKTLPPVRPIISHCNSLLSPSASFIDHVLQPLARSYPDYLHNSSILLQILTTLHVPDDALLVSIDVESLYPSIPQTDCLNIIYNQMYKRKDLLLCDPNLIIHLLHTSVNYNYFKFCTLTFQQIKGTAMGASFSPTIANIFLSVTLDNFLQTQTLKPLLFKRYIDDILLIWPHSPAELDSFLSDLNSYHSSLHFTSKHSSTEIDFLDITVYKHDSFFYTNTLDTKTYQKPKNLYQYLHYNSAHPRTLYKGLIKGECIRYLRTNSLKSTYQATLSLFRQRLLRRGYPDRLISTTISNVPFSHRKHYLTPKPTRTSMRRPIFKCPPPPRFDILKATILQHYRTIVKHTPHPRFVTMGHKTLQKELVRAKVTLTDEQLVDVILTLGNHGTLQEHVTAGVLPALHSTHNTIQTCKHPRCTTCLHYNTNRSFISTSTRQQYIIRHSFNCNSNNVIYLITCTKCKKQYVGYTETRLKDRINRHRTNIHNNKIIYISIHFNFPDHKLANLSVQAIDTATTRHELKKLEQYWILTLQTYIPKGLNVSLGSI